MPGPSSASRARLAAAHLYLVTDARSRQGDLAEFLEAVLAAGVDIVQLREKEAEARDLLHWAPIFRAAADRHGALFMVNDRVDVAVAAGADGVHLGQDDLPVHEARAIAGAAFVIGLSTHSPEQFDDAPPGADYVCVGPVHATPTKPGRRATGLDVVRHAAAAQRDRPWFAIGGIDSTTVAPVLSAGARRIAVVRAICDAEDPGAAAAALHAIVTFVENPTLTRAS